MGVRLPVVIVNGQLQQLQSGDTILAPTATAEIRALTNGEVAAVVIGSAVYVSAASTFKKALGTALSTAGVLGLVFDVSVTNGTSGNVCVGGTMTATTAQWDAVASTTGGLSFGTIYYLSTATAGLITATAPTTAGQVVVPVGKAVNSTDMEIFGPSVTSVLL